MKHSMWFGVLSLAAVSLSAAEVDFSHDIVPVLKQHCGQCHTGDQQKGGLSLNTRQAVLAGGESGAVIVVGQGADSDLATRMATDDEALRMPPEGPRVPPDQVALLKRWIDEGLRWEDGFAFGRQAYEPPLKPRRPELPPAVDGREHPVDRLIDAYLAQHATAAPAADRRRGVCAACPSRPHRPAAHAGRTAGVPRRRRPDKRARLVRALLARDVDYAEHWLTFWNDLLRNDYARDRLHHGRPQPDHALALRRAGHEHALRPVRPRADRAADGRERGLSARHPLARRR